MSETLESVEEIIAQEYGHLKDTAFFDFHKMCPASKSQIEKIKTLGIRIQPSPHSSEEQSAFDRSLSTIRETLADIFNSSQVSFAVVLFPSREAAVDSIFEGFPWQSGYQCMIAPNWNVNLDSALKFPQRFGAQVTELNDKPSSKCLLLFSHEADQVNTIEDFRKKSSGTRYLFCDATRNAVFDLPDLFKIPYDFTLLSMKQFCGADVTAAIMRLESADLLVPTYYGGGAISFSCARMNVHRNFKEHSKRFENGTPSMLPIFSGCTGLLLWEKMRKIENLHERGIAIIQKLKEAASKYFNVEDDGPYAIILGTDQDAQALQIEFAKHKVFLGLENGKLVASIGLCTKEADVDLFVQAANSIFNK